jgi:hypothetical protein
LARLAGIPNSFTDAAPVREHVLALRKAGIGWRQAECLAGVPGSTVARLLFQGTKMITRRSAEAILAVRPVSHWQVAAEGVIVDATGTRRRLQALIACGWSQPQLGARLGMQGTNLGRLMAGPGVRAGTARAVAVLYDELWNTPPPERTHVERQAAARARNRADRNGWPRPGAWDDDKIDDPGALVPAGWKRA